MKSKDTQDNVQSNPAPDNNQPSNDQTGESPQLVFMTRPHAPVKPPMSDEVRQLHQASKRKYPELNLSDGEFILSAIQRHPIGLLQIWSIVGIVAAIMLGVLAAISAGMFDTATGAESFPVELVAIPLVLLLVLALLFGIIETIVYNANKFFLTNESVIQHIQTSLFSKREQTVSLANIEDASYSQGNIVESLLDYGMIRLSTEGDETTYRFSYATHPKKQVAILNNAVEAFKNGRPVTGLDDDDN